MVRGRSSGKAPGRPLPQALAGLCILALAVAALLIAAWRTGSMDMVIGLVGLEPEPALEQPVPRDTPRIEIEPASKDLGKVSQAEGKTLTDFIVRNTGKSDLVIDSLDTSCMCTSAQIIHVHDESIPHAHPDEEEGPIFGMSMHGTNPEGWSATVAPGAFAILRVWYDPNVHGDLRGYVQRRITVSSNDPVNFQSTVSIEFEQVA